ncbi:BnaA06g20550D [Brassica napus]|uniref:BnaA06g20550D protein n=1 Tax=Brassica napus TaxID=3708 RepID=A0A078G8S6_BRANA|nr:BnaA06g20550D [Brassica napus]
MDENGSNPRYIRLPSDRRWIQRSARFFQGGKDGQWGLLMINRALKTSKQEARMARFKAEVADKEIARLKDELESSRRRERESRLRRRELKGRYKALTDYRKCRGTVGGLYLTQHPDYSFINEYAKRTGNMAEKNKDLKISGVEEEIWEQWETVPVSHDTVEAETGDPGEAGEVDQPVAPLDVNSYLIGRSMSGDFDLGDLLQGSL